MKKEIKQTEKTTASSSANKKNTRPFTAKKNGYKEDVYNSEQQASYNKSDAAKKDNKRNTSGPKS
ncbi:MAG: hypothetical protein ABJB05_00040 [Parafilimonas sp.]